MQQYCLSDEQLEKECDDGLFIEVSQQIEDYMKLGHCLDLSKETLTNISTKKNGDVEKKNAVLWSWKRKNGSAATFGELVKVFLKMEDKFVAESILKYLSIKFTSAKHQMPCKFAPQKAKDRYPNWDEFTESDKEKVINTLMDENRDVREAYTFFVGKIIPSFKERNVDPMYIQSLATSFGTSRSLHRSLVFDFSKDDRITTVFSELSKHCSWFNYELMQVIVKIAGNDSEKTYLKTYENEHLIPYLKHSIFEIPCDPSEDQSQRTNLLFKISEDLCITGSEVKAIQRNLAKLLGFPNGAILHFQDYNVGCIELVFSLPTVILNESSHNSQLFVYIKWEESRKCYKVNVDLVTVL